jgi:acetyl-CoA C-acetyltransferase
MGEHAALTALEWQIAARSRTSSPSRRTSTSRRVRPRLLDDLVTPFRGLDRDQNLRPDSSLEKLAKLKPVFGKGEAATMTAGNSTPLTDGASAVLLSSRSGPPSTGCRCWPTSSTRDRGGRLRARRRGLLMAPAYAVPRMLERERADPARTSTSTRSTRRSRPRCSRP